MHSQITIPIGTNMALPLLDAEQARNCSRGNALITQEILIISLAIIEAVEAELLTVTIQFDTTVEVNPDGPTFTITTGSPMTNETAFGFSVYSVWSGATVDAKITEQLETVTAYFTKYGYSLSIISTNGTTISWKLSW